MTMQLPRGTFREIIKQRKIRFILEELGHERFCGICTLSFPAGTGILVFRNGDCILAKVMALYGDACLVNLIPHLDETGDAAIALLGETQVKLALEFNKKALVKKPGILPTGPKAHSSHPTSRTDANTPAGKGSPAGTETVIVRPEAHRKKIPPINHLSHPASRSPLSETRKSGHEGADEGSGTDSPGSTSFDRDMETLDSLDLEKVSSKIRGDCKTLVKHLDLEYLLER